MFDDRKESLFERIFKTADIYGKGVEFTIDGKKTFKTAFGGIMTLATFVLLGFYLAYKIVQLADRDYILTNAEETEDLQDNVRNVPYNMTTDNF